MADGSRERGQMFAHELLDQQRRRPVRAVPETAPAREHSVMVIETSFGPVTLKPWRPK